MASVFPEFIVRKLTNEAFSTDNGRINGLVSKLPVFVLVYDSSPESERLLFMWNDLSSKINVPVLAKVDSHEHSEFMNYVQSVSSGPVAVPIIVFFRDGEPVNVYSGIVSENSILYYISTSLHAFDDESSSSSSEDDES
jgi:thioredoxin-like negative regulator of GroEL